jgi:hypothetical protein
MMLIVQLTVFSLLGLAQVAAEVVDQCDQTKCQSAPGIFGDEYDCWAVEGADSWKPYACADGYEAQDLSNVTTIYDPPSGTTFRYFTCCPPGHTSSPILEECTDKVCASRAANPKEKDCWADGVNEPMTCDGDDYKFPRKTGGRVKYHSKWYSHYLCCKTSDGTPPLQKSHVIFEGLLAALGGLGLCCALILIFGIVCSPRARATTFNLYLVFLAIPDAAFNLLALVRGLYNTSGTPVAWGAIHFIGYFYSATNIWLNTVVVCKVYILLRNSRVRRHTRPPSSRSVYIETAVIYFLSSIWAIWMTFLIDGRINRLHDKGGLIAYSLSYIVLALGPFAYSFYVLVRVLKGKLLPLSGRTRVLALYFFRIVFIFIFMWIPSIILINLERSNKYGDRVPLHYIVW